MGIQYPKNILVAPLDWGTGHTARCVPVIRYLQELGHRVIVAGNEWQRTFIKASFDHIDVAELEGYNVTYSKWNRFGQIGVLSQLPGLQRVIGAEHNWLKRAVKEWQIDGIISDNRYGLYHSDVPCVIMTHQIRVMTGMGNFMDRAIQKIHYRYLDHFNETWIADNVVPPGLGGSLSHSEVIPVRSKYVGLLSQFDSAAKANETDGSLLILLSGPEPLRSELSRILWQQVQQYSGKVVFIDGSDRVTPPGNIPPHITYHKWLAHKELAPLLSAAGMVICRSGYSTLMDLVALGKKAILIPTPGQTEQEYLGRQLHEQGIFYSSKQKGFDLVNALKEAEQSPYHSLSLNGAYSAHRAVIDEWVKGL